jgi:hypothetical protein
MNTGKKVLRPVHALSLLTSEDRKTKLIMIKTLKAKL